MRDIPFVDIDIVDFQTGVTESPANFGGVPIGVN